MVAFRQNLIPWIRSEGLRDQLMSPTQVCYILLVLCFLSGPGFLVRICLRFCSLGLLCDLLWSDPEKELTGWGENDRGVSFTFGQDIVHNFLRKHDLDLICRAHQVLVAF